MMKNIGISTEEWNALSAGRTVTIDRVEGDRKDEFKPGDKLAVHALYQEKTAEVTIGRLLLQTGERIYAGSLRLPNASSPRLQEPVMGKTRTCGNCPKWVRGWCSIYAKRTFADSPACDYGRKLMYNAYMAKYMRNYKRRNAHETGTAETVVHRPDRLRLDKDRAVSAGKAARNAKYRLVMGDGCRDRPHPGQLAEMRDIEVLEVVADD